MELIFDTKGNEKQKQVARYWADDSVSDILYGGSKGSGKSFLGCSLIFADAYIYDGTFYFISRSSLTDLRKYTIPSIYEVFQIWGLDNNYYKYNGQDNYFQLCNNSRVYLLDAKYLPSDPLFQRFGSMQMTRGWIEEAGEFMEAAKNNLAASIGRWKNKEFGLSPKLLQTCNPSKNYLYHSYYKPNKDNSLPPFRKFIQALPQDNKMLPDGYLENLRNQLSKSEQKRLLEGEWEYDTDPAALIQYEKILDCFTNDFPSLSGEKYITADIARLGSDKIVIIVWDGWRVIEIKSFTKERLTTTGQVIEQLRTFHSIPKSNVICDEDGVGGGIVDFMGYKGFVNNSRPLPNPQTQVDENYNHLKSQCYFRLADRINKNGLYINCTDSQMKSDIIQELEQVKQYNMDKDGKKQVLPKDKVKENIGRSSDYSDSLMMREYFDLAPKINWEQWREIMKS